MGYPTTLKSNKGRLGGEGASIMHSSFDRCRSQRVPCACCYSWYVQASRIKKTKIKEVKREMGAELVPVLRQAVNLPLEK